uniref:Uncharacterized protein n=1 Tax=Rhizophora mucronata TaxID=61149 RepID=A0A2P2R2K0_RHIMU
MLRKDENSMKRDVKNSTVV